MYYIYDNYHEEWYEVSFVEFEDAEIEMEYLIRKRKAKDLPYDFDIYQKITQKKHTDFCKKYSGVKNAHKVSK